MTYERSVTFKFKRKSIDPLSKFGAPSHPSHRIIHVHIGGLPWSAHYSIVPTYIFNTLFTFCFFVPGIRQAVCLRRPCESDRVR